MSDLMNLLGALTPGQLRAAGFFFVLDIPLMIFLGRYFFGDLGTFGEALKWSYISPFYWWSSYCQSSYYNRVVTAGVVELYWFLFIALWSAEIYFFVMPKAEAPLQSAPTMGRAVDTCKRQTALAISAPGQRPKRLRPVH